MRPAVEPCDLGVLCKCGVQTGQEPRGIEQRRPLLGRRLLCADPGEHLLNACLFKFRLDFGKPRQAAWGDRVLVKGLDVRTKLTQGRILEIFPEHQRLQFRYFANEGIESLPVKEIAGNILRLSCSSAQLPPFPPLFLSGGQFCEQLLRGRLASRP